MLGTVFDVRRFSTHDGGGIRTTVFLKGCPLRCVWCQNPEGIDPRTLPVHFPGRCIRCGGCLALSRAGGVYAEGGAIRLRRERPEDWQQLARGCPAAALALDSRPYTPEQLVEELLKDEVFFRRGGGVTLSGGEPLLQGEFAAALLRLLHGRGVHTAIETSLSVPAGTLQAALPYLDLIYADLKIFDEAAHRRYVGASNRLIKENLALLLTGEARGRAIIRTPLIPGYTATAENLGAIAAFLSGLYPDVSYELLNYNPLAEAKYRLVGRDYCFDENPKAYTRAELKAFGDIARSNGIKNLILEI